ncbi:MAG: hypothetical protein Q9213_006273 [Squamulea squamosa]
MTGQDGRGQDSYHNSAGSNARYGYQTSSSQSAQRQQQSYNSQQQQSTYSPAATSTDHPNTKYARYGDVAGGMSQAPDSRGGSGYAPRSSIDTTALGNLAHASSLGQDSRHTTGSRDSTSLQQLINYNRSQQPQTYDDSLAYGTGTTSYGYGQQLSDSRESANSRNNSYSSRHQAQRQDQSPAPTQQPYSQYATSATYSIPTPAYAATSEVAQSSNPQSSYQITNDDQRQRTQPYYSQPVRPASGQSHHATVQKSQLSPQVSQSPTVSTYRASTTNTNNPTTPNAYPTSIQQDHNRTQPPQQALYAGHRTSSAADQGAHKRRSSTASTASKPSTQNQHASVRDLGKHQQSTVAEGDHRMSKSLDEQIPKTVDPSHVFNHYEYQRRQAAAAEAERVKKAAEAEEVRKANEAAAALKRVSESQLQQTPNGATTDAGTKEKEEQMAAEMRLMIEKMRDYKSKDPSLFSQIWEQVKKTQPAGSTPTIPPLSAKDLTGSTTTQQSQVNGVTHDRQVISPSPGLSQPVSSTGQSSGDLPDLGKFPAQRRKRGPYKTDGSAKKSKSSKTTGPSQVNGSKSSPIIDPALVEASNHAAQQVPTPAQSSPYALPPAANREVIYVSGTGPQTSPQVQSGLAASSSGSKPSRPSAPTSTQGTPTPATATVQAPATGGTAWPEHKKWDLAVAAQRTLLASPINAGRTKSITAEQIFGFLNQNPSFEQLCQMIEARGLIIERSHFARSLLEAIPDIGTSVRQRQQNALANRQPAATPQKGQPNGSTIPQTNGSGYGVPTAKPSSDTQPLKEFSQTSGAPTADMTAPNLKAPSTQPPANDKPAAPLTKQEMARKRNISDIVDLSQLSDDDLPPPPPLKVQRLDEEAHAAADAAPATAGYAINVMKSNQELQPPPPPIQQMPHSAYGPSHFFNPAQHYPVPYQSPYEPLPPKHYVIPAAPPIVQSTGQTTPSYSAQQRDLINSEDIIQPIDKNKAKKRKRYNPKTIVRDVLIAAGRHPTMQPLNYHLEPLRKTFKHVGDVSDLSTFRWDLVDPGGPPALGPVAVGVRSSTIADESDADDEGPKPSRRTEMASREDSEGGPSVTGATAPHVPREFFVLKRHGIRLCTLTSNPDVSHPPKLLGPQRKRAPDNSEQRKPEVDKSWMSSGLGSSAKSMHNSIAGTPQAVSAGGVSVMTQPSPSGVPRRGRPPKAISATVERTTSEVPRRGRPPGAKNKHSQKSSGTPPSSNIPTRPRVDTTPARPSGLRNTVASADGIAVVVPSPSPSIAEPRPRGRPRKSPRSSQQSTPIHRVYKCQWKSCPAELHNLETLKKHVLKHGDKFGGPFPCLWKGCGKVSQNDEEDGMDEGRPEEESQPLEYGTKEIWAKHIDRRHLADYAWKLGDGPSVRSDSEVSDYVSDSAKRGGAPIISNDKGRPDPLPLMSSGKPAKLYHKAHGNNTELGKAKAFLEASEARKRSLGPGIDRTGATFVTKRKNALLDESVVPLKRVQQSDDEDVL